VKTKTIFTPFHLVHVLEAILPIECEINSLKLVFDLFVGTTFEEENLVYLEWINKHLRDDDNMGEAHTKNI
jgi:hypothetical protein